VSGGASFNGNNIQVPEFNGVTGILNVAGHPTTGVASSLQAGTLWVGRQGVGDVELSAGALIHPGLLYLGSNGYGKMHVFRGFGVFSGTATLNVGGQLLIGDNTAAGSPGGTGVLAVDQGVVQTALGVIMGDDDGGGPDTLRMNGGFMSIGDRLYENPNNSSVLDLHGGTLFINDSNTDYGSAFNQAVPLSIDGAGGGPTLTLYGAATANLKTATPLSLIVGRSGGGTLNLTGFGAGFCCLEDLEVTGNAVVADQSTGTGIIRADQGGAINVQGTLTVGPGKGLVQARNGSYIVARSETDVLAADSTGGTLQADTLSRLDMNGGLAIAGTLAAPWPGPATVRADSTGELNVAGEPLRIWNGGLLALGEGGTALVDSALCSGQVQLVHGNIVEGYGNAAFHLLNGGVMHGVGTVHEAVSLDDTTARLETLASDPPGTLTVGDSSRTDAFRSQGIVRVESDTLAILAKGGPDLGHVILAGGTLSLPGGGHLRPADVLEGTGRLAGNLTDDGLVDATGVIDVPGHLTVVAGDIAGNGLTVQAGGELSARGHLSGLLTLAGQLDMGTILAMLTMARAPVLQPTSMLTMRIGSAAHGAQDTLVINEALTIAGTLDLRTWKPDPSAPGDTLTLISAPSFTGTFSKVTIDGVDAPAYVQVIYEPTRVRVAVLQSTVDVPPPTPGHGSSIALRFAGAGTLREPSFALDLPHPATVVVSVYNVAGRRIAELENGKLDAGRYRFPFEGVPGVYYAQALVTDQTGRRALTAHVVRLP
jgi:hypothetical protein